MIPTHLQVRGENVASLPIPLARAIFLTTQEALANIARHARASKVNVDVLCPHENNSISVVITDDGRGFDTTQQNNMVGHGLSNMRARAEMLNGTFNIHSTKGRGTKVILTLPQV